VRNESAKWIRYFKKDLQSLPSALPTSKSRISKRQNGLMFGLIDTEFSFVKSNSRFNNVKHSKI
jgi:hypothetical protein